MNILIMSHQKALLIPYKGLSLEVAAEGIRVNCVRSGLIHTDMHADGGEPERVERLQTVIPLQRGG